MIIQYLLALIVGATIFLGLSPHELWYFPLLSISILAALWRPNLSAGKSYLLAFSFNFGVFLVGVHWVFISIHTHGQVPAVLAGLFTGLFVLFVALVTSLPWLLSPLFKGEKRMIAFPAIWCVSEWLRSWIFTGFPWLYLGQAHLHTPLAGWMPILGVLGVSLLVCITATSLITIARQRRLSPVLAQSLILGVIWIGGSLLSDKEWTTPMEAELHATLIQPNIKLADKWDPSKTDEVLEVLTNESEGHWGDNLIIWPEAAIPFYGDQARNYLRQKEDQAAASNTAFISGYLSYDYEARRFHNAIGGVGDAQGEYLKQRLVPFGEYVPLENWIRGLIMFFDLPMSVITAGGPDQQPLKIQQNGSTYIAAPAICYEIAYPSLVARLAGEANLIITLSNDAWFGDSIGPWQHMEIAKVRALENGKPVLRVTNNGVTASIDKHGNIIDMLPQFETGSLQTAVETMTGATPYSQYRNLPVLVFCCLLLIAGMSWGRTR